MKKILFVTAILLSASACSHVDEAGVNQCLFGPCEIADAGCSYSTNPSHSGCTKAPVTNRWSRIKK